MKNEKIDEKEVQYMIAILEIHFNKLGYSMSDVKKKKDDKGNIELIFKGVKL